MGFRTPGERTISNRASRRIVVAAGGGIAGYKVPDLVRQLVRAGHSVRCALTEAGSAFVSPLALQTVSGQPVRRSLLDPGEEGQIGHIDLADWAELVIVAPATADLLARMAHGLADDLVTTVLLATRAPVLVAPAMNVNMWEHAATRANRETLIARGVHEVGPESGELACGWEGAGRMAEPAAIVEAAERVLGPDSLAGERVLVTAGGTRERIDPVRAITNRSSGKMGYALAAEAARRGADVVLVSGPTALDAPSGVRRVDVDSALEMRDAVLAEFDASGIAICCAAVSDFRPARVADQKIKKEALDPDAGLQIELVRNPDILAEISARRGSRVVVGFAAESYDLIAASTRKLARKGCDLLVANDISRRDAGFESDSNAVVLLEPGAPPEELPLLDKRDVAVRILDRIEKLRAERRP
jgi:phosphopantothenoylcysteine decarboxylase/phosphopantothenate--cysteine ligase